MEDFAHQMRWLAELLTPKRRRSGWCWTTCTHKPASLYETFEPKEARRVQRLEFPILPSRSWLNMAEIEFSVFSNQCESPH